jgi:hypothetical protein
VCQEKEKGFLSFRFGLAGRNQLFSFSVNTKPSVSRAVVEAAVLTLCTSQASPQEGKGRRT